MTSHIKAGKYEEREMGMIRIVLASHGKLADGMKDSVGIIAGSTERIQTLCAYTERASSVDVLIDRLFSSADPGDTYVVITDVLGGSVNTEFAKKQRQYGYSLVFGMNLALVLEILQINDAEDIQARLSEIVENNKNFIGCFVQSAEEETEDF